jgi:hypothetical protein
MALPPLILRRPIAVRFVDAMAVVRTSGESAEWPALLRLAADSERQEGGLTAEAVRSLLPLPLPAVRALLRQGVELGMLGRDGERFRLTALGRACLRQDAGMDGHHGWFRFAVTDEPLLAGRQLLHVEERRDLGDLEETTLEDAADALHTEPDAFFSSVAQRGLLFSVLRTSAQMRPVPRKQDLTLMMEVEIRPGQDGPFNLRLTGQWPAGKGTGRDRTGGAMDIRLTSAQPRRADQGYAELLQMAAAASGQDFLASPGGQADLSTGYPTRFADAPTEARVHFRLRVPKIPKVQFKVPGQFDLGTFEVEAFEVPITPAAGDEDLWGQWLQCHLLGPDKSPGGPARAGEGVRQRLPSYQPRSGAELARLALGRSPLGRDVPQRASLLEAHDLLLWEPTDR